MDLQLNTVVHDALLLLLQIAVFVAIGLLQKWKAQAVEYYTKHSTTQQREWLRMVGNEAFHYAERVFATFDGPGKLNEAVKYVLDRADFHGIHVTYPEVRAVIEKAWSEFQVQQQPGGTEQVA
ncbi:phage holin, LLH family [Tumebacillus flagellatus]|uniref:Phage holin n=1 Tax=Tumebacillus flagellatus TaxID=1157490 RepID=A0A074LRE4_9BACL|nr:phage holin, LLH family [Tumebacillus flagellatus]KEO83050.1 hypothetical protein EL26_12235 [Tumebacillus flagellatus]